MVRRLALGTLAALLVITAGAARPYSTGDSAGIVIGPVGIELAGSPGLWTSDGSCVVWQDGGLFVC